MSSQSTIQVEVGKQQDLQKNNMPIRECYNYEEPPNMRNLQMHLNNNEVSIFRDKLVLRYPPKKQSSCCPKPKSKYVYVCLCVCLCVCTAWGGEEGRYKNIPSSICVPLSTPEASSCFIFGRWVCSNLEYASIRFIQIGQFSIKELTLTPSSRPSIFLNSCLNCITLQHNMLHSYKLCCKLTIFLNLREGYSSRMLHTWGCSSRIQRRRLPYVSEVSCWISAMHLSFFLFAHCVLRSESLFHLLLQNHDCHCQDACFFSCI